MTTAVIVAAGRGTRMGPDVDKLFLEVAGRPVVAHTWARFDAAPAVDEVVLVVRGGQEEAFAALADELGVRKPWRLAPGGAERQDSVWNGLAAAAPGTEIAAIHDGARPCTAHALIAATVAAARAHGAAVAAQRVTDTLKEAGDDGFILRTVDRARLWSVQTPQAFRLEVLRRALTAVRERGRHVTDDTAACELIGQPVRLVECAAPNPKITVPADLPYLAWLLAREAAAAP
jgi:2-C-methyl-D-erythritol 4-phosphate cytidylyltransferase